MRFSVFFLLLALAACASAALELRCSSGTLQGVGGTLDGVFSTKAGVQRPIDCASACALSNDCKSYQYCGFGSFNGTCAFAPSRNGTAPSPAFATKGDCLLANGTSWRQAPSKPEYGGWTFGVGCRSVEVADAVVPVEKEGEVEEVKPVVAPAAAANAAPPGVAARPPTKAAVAAAEPALVAEDPISALHKPSSAKGASAAATLEAGTADPNAPEVVSAAPPAAPKGKPAAPVVAADPVAPVVTPASSKVPLVPAAAAATEQKAAAPKSPVPAAAAKPAAAAAKPAAAPDAASLAVGPAGPGSLSAPVKGYLSGRGASVAELQPGIESASECASICAAAEKNAASSCAGYSWCASAAGCGNVATGVCQLWSGKPGSGKPSPEEKSGWVSAAREVVPAAAAAAAAVQPAMKTQTATVGA